MVPQIKPCDISSWCADSANAESPALPVVLDVREPWEIQTASVKPQGFSLVQIPMQSIPAHISDLQQKHGLDHPIACLCHHGMRSLQVATYLTQSGFSEVVNVQGGIDAWSVQLDPSVARY